MKKYLLIIAVVSLFMCPNVVSAKRGCCSHHGGVAGCSSNGRQICNDGTLSPSCTCTPPVSYTYGCMDSSAKNYNSKANRSDVVVFIINMGAWTHQLKIIIQKQIKVIIIIW